MRPIILDGNSLKIDAVHTLAHSLLPVTFSAEALKRVRASRHVVDEWTRKNEVIYGVTTGFGEFSNVRIGQEHIEELQRNLIVSHSAGAGEPLPNEVVRAMMLLRMNALLKGYSGIRVETLEFLRTVFNAGIIPVVPSRGSVGSSGDLVQLAHLVLAMMGEGNVWMRGATIGAKAALAKIGLKPLRLAAKEGLALINGTQMMTAFAALVVYEAQRLMRMADISAAMSLEALKGSDTAFDPRIQRVRAHIGQGVCAANMRALLAGSEIRESHRHGDPRVQDAYSLRCIPQVHGASRDAIAYAANVVSIEINSATDNPLIFADTKTHLEGGNFHGQPVAFALDFLGIALAELANISERRIERMVNGALSGLPRFLTENGGLHSGLMIAQYTAASLVSENKVLAHPASVDSIPTSANQEDHNSMGSIGALKAWQILKNVQTVIAIETMTAAQGIDFSRVRPDPRKPMRAGKGVQAAHAFIRARIPHLANDRVLHNDITAALAYVTSAELLHAVERRAGPLR